MGREIVRALIQGFGWTRLADPTSTSSGGLSSPGLSLHGFSLVLEGSGDLADELQLGF